MDKSSSISSWDDRGFIPQQDWQFEAIAKINADDSTDDTQKILKKFNTTRSFSSNKQKIGPKCRLSAPMQSIRQQHRTHYLAQKLRENLAACRIQRWYRSSRSPSITSKTCTILPHCQSCVLL